MTITSTTIQYLCFCYSDIVPLSSPRRSKTQDCPSDIDVTVEFGSLTKSVRWNVPEHVLHSSHTPGDEFSVGSTPVSYTYNTLSGLNMTCLFVITVIQGESIFKVLFQR